MDARRRILEALLHSAATPRPSGALDVTAEGLASSALSGARIPCRRAPRAGELYGLVVCEVGSLWRVQPFTEPDGTLLVFVPHGEQGDVGRASDELERVGQTRCPGGAWMWLRRRIRAHTVAPRVSTIVVTGDDDAGLAHLLRSLADEPTDPAWELIVVDRRAFESPNPAEGLLGAEVGLDVRRIAVTPGTSDADAVFAGASTARGEMLVPVGLDVLPMCGFVCALTAALDSDELASQPVFRGTLYEKNGRTPAAATSARGPVALHRTLLPRSSHAFETVVGTASGPMLRGFRGRLSGAASTRSGSAWVRGGVGQGPQKLDQAAQSQPYAVLAQHG